MSLPSRGVVRLLRTAVTTGLVLVLATLAHMTADGDGPAPAAMVVLVSVVAPAAYVATSRRLGLLRGGLFLGCGQILVHTALAMMTPSAPAADLGVAHAGHHVHGGMPTGLGGHDATAVDVAPGASDMSGPGSMSPSMLTAHLVATLVTAWLLSRGERALWQVIDRLMPVVAHPSVAPPAPVGSVIGSHSWAITKTRWTPLASRAPPLAAT